MKFWETFRYEVVYQTRSITTWGYFLFLLVVTYLLAREVFIDEAVIGGYSRNAPYYVAKIAVIAYLVGLWMVAPVSGNAAARDVETRMHPLLYTVPTSKLIYLGGRFLAAFALGAIIMTAIPAGILGASLLPGEDAGLTGSINPVAYLNTYFLFLLPNTFVAVALMFSVAVMSRRGIASFLVGVLIFFTTFATWQLIAVEQGNWNLAKILDPLGITLIQELKGLWTPLEKNTLMPGAQPWTLLNRLLWCSIAFGLLTFTYFRFKIGPAAKGDKKDNAQQALSTSSAVAENFLILNNASIFVPPVQRSFGLSARAFQVITIANESFKIVMARGWIVFACLSIFVFVTSPYWFNEYHSVPELPVTGHLLILVENINNHGMWLVIPLLILYYAGELVWHERDARMNEITGAAPMPVWVYFTGKFAGLCLALVLMQLLLMISGMVVQMRLGYYNFEIALYLKILFGIRLVDYVLLALLAFVIQVVVNQKYIAHLIAILFFAVLFIGPFIGIEPGLLVYGSDPGWTYSEIRGLEPYLGPWLLFKAYWAAWALLLAVIANLLWPRGTEVTFKEKLREGSRRLTSKTKAIASFAVLSIVIFGGVIFYNTNVLHAFSGAPREVERKAEYEKRYSKYANIPQPWLTGTKLHVEIYPKQRAIDFRGSYDFVNRTVSEIDTIHVATAMGVENRLIRLNRAARTVLVDEDLGYQIYLLETPLSPGDSLRLDFHVNFNPQGFPNYGIDASLVENGSYFGDEWLPKIGYQREREIEDQVERSEQGLGPRRELWPQLAVARMGIAGGQERINFEAVVGTDKGQTAVTQGKLQGSWMDNERSYFHYASEAPIKNNYAFFSANYDLHKAQWKHPGTGQIVDIEILYHPGHTLNLARMVSSIKASLAYLTRQLGPYPHSEIRFIENTGYNKGMFAHPTNIWYRTGYALLNPGEDPEEVDVTYSVVAHEVAHQWWAHQLTPAIVKGKGLLTETLAWYSALEIVEQAQGREKFLSLIHLFQQEYFSPQARSGQPLLEADDHNLIYRKGPLALYALREYVGKEQIRTALRNLFKNNALGTPPLPTPLDLYRELQKITPDSIQYLLHDLFAANTYWDLRTERSIARQTKTGNWEVSLDLLARKYTIDTVGTEADVAMDDWVQIGIFESKEKEGAAPLYLKWHRLRSGKQTIIVNLPIKPTYAGVDPSYLLMDLKRMDNKSEVILKNNNK